MQQCWEALHVEHQALDRLMGRIPVEKSWNQRRDDLIAKADIVLFETIGHSHVIGYCLTTISSECIGEIDSLYLSPEYRGRGYGRVLFQRSLSWLAQYGITTPQLWVHPANFAAIRFYWSFGFYTQPFMERVPLEAQTSHVFHQEAAGQDVPSSITSEPGITGQL